MKRKFSLFGSKNSRTGLVLALVLALITLVTPMTPLQAAPPLKTDLFAKFPTPPGYPEGIVVKDNNTIYVGSNGPLSGDGIDMPSRVYEFDKHGNIKKEFVIKGQEPKKQGILGMAMDGKGMLYIVDHYPQRVIRLNPKTGEQSTYATFRDVAPCVKGKPVGNCSAESDIDRPSFPDDPVFGPDGSLYVTDLYQALIWRIPPGGGKAEVFFTHPDLHSTLGPNGIRFADKNTLIFAQSTYGTLESDALFTSPGRIYTLKIKPNGKAGKLSVFWQGDVGEIPDGLTVGESGKIYVALGKSAHDQGSLLVLSPDGKELERTSNQPVGNEKRDIPYNTPASAAFYNKYVLVTNQSILDGNPETMAVMKVKVNERGKKLFLPIIP